MSSLTSGFGRVLQPLDSIGLMKSNMVHILRTLRDNREMLISIMEIYLKACHHSRSFHNMFSMMACLLSPLLYGYLFPQEPVLDWIGVHKGRDEWDQVTSNAG